MTGPTIRSPGLRACFPLCQAGRVPASVSERALALTSYLVRDYDEAIAFFVGVLAFDLVEDTVLGDGKRWVVVRPGCGGGALLLARAANEEQCALVGRQAGGRVFLFLTTDDFDRDYAAMTQAGVRFLEQPRIGPYGRVTKWEDLYGQVWDLIQPATLPAPGG